MPERTSAQPMARRVSRRSGELLGTRDSGIAQETSVIIPGPRAVRNPESILIFPH